MCNHGCKAIFDTGTYFMYGPKDYIQIFDQNIVINDCIDLDNLPDIAFDIVCILFSLFLALT